MTPYGDTGAHAGTERADGAINEARRVAAEARTLRERGRLIVCQTDGLLFLLRRAMERIPQVSQDSSAGPQNLL